MWDFCARLDGRRYLRRTLFTVSGTAAPWWSGYPADLGRALADGPYWRWQPVDYPAATFRMGRSVAAGREELVRQIGLHPGEFALSGYSQGEIVVGQCYKYDLLPEDGRLHHRLNDLVAAANFGGPMREKGHSYPGGKDPGGEGISPDRLEDTPDWWREYADPKDLYATMSGIADPNSVEHMRAIYNGIQGHWATGSDDLLEQIFELLLNPFREVPAAIRAAAKAWVFFTNQPGPQDHTSYHLRQVEPGVTYLQHALQYLTRVGERHPVAA